MLLLLPLPPLRLRLSNRDPSSPRTPSTSMCYPPSRESTQPTCSSLGSTPPHLSRFAASRVSRKLQGICCLYYGEGRSGRKNESATEHIIFRIERRGSIDAKREVEPALGAVDVFEGGDVLWKFQNRCKQSARLLPMSDLGGRCRSVGGGFWW